MTSRHTLCEWVAAGLVCSAHSRTCTHLSLARGEWRARAVRDPFGKCVALNLMHVYFSGVANREQIASHRLNHSQQRPWPLNFSWLCAETHSIAHCTARFCYVTRIYSGLYTWNSTAQVHTQRYIYLNAPSKVLLVRQVGGKHLWNVLYNFSDF